MNKPNAFLGKPDQPSEVEVDAALGPAAPLWTELIHGISADAGKITEEWQGILFDLYGWSLRISKKSRNIVVLAPCNDCFRVAFMLSDGAVEAVKESNLPRKVARILASAPRHPNGTGLRLTVNSASDLPAIRRIVQIKLAN
jgi:hypothetical protein